LDSGCSRTTAFAWRWVILIVIVVINRFLVVIWVFIRFLMVIVGLHELVEVFLVG
jgi:hypothetical protein